MIPLFVMVYQTQRIMNVRLYCTTFYSFAVKIHAFVCPTIRWIFNVEKRVPEPRKQF
jgi:hypothetical protein